jgi:glycosyltransferase involved in cell wall biosynthesis
MLAQEFGLLAIGEHAEILRQRIATSTAEAEQSRREAAARVDEATARTNEAAARTEQAEKARREAETLAKSWEARALESERARRQMAHRITAARRDVYDANCRKEQAETRAQEAEANATRAEAMISGVVLQAEQARIERDQASRQLDLLLSSTSWQVTASLRVAASRLPPTLRRALGGALKRICRLLTLKLPGTLGKRHTASTKPAQQPGLTPIRDLRRLSDGEYMTTGRDPQFVVHPDRHALRRGWALVTLEVRDAQQPLRPILYAFGADPGSQPTAFRLPVVTRGMVRKVVAFPAEVHSLRLDPIDVAGACFSIATASVHHVGKLSLFWRTFSVLSWVQRKDLLAAALRRDFATVDHLAHNALTSDDEAEYSAWVKLYDTLSPSDTAAISERVQHLRWRPLLSVVMPVYNPRPKYLRQALDSLVHQLYPDWELCIADDASTDPEIKTVLDEYAQADKRIKIAYRRQNGHVCAASNTAMQLASGEYLVLMDHDDLLPAHALYMVADELNRHPDADLIYTDEDKIDDENRRHDPHFKTDWNRELFYSQNIIAHMAVYRTSLMREIDGFRVGYEGSQDYDLALRFIRRTQPSRVRHIPHVLYHWRIFPGVTSLSSDNPQKSVDTARRALEEYFSEAEPSAAVVPYEKFPSWWRIKRSLPEPLPRVSLIVPTRDRVDLLKVAIDGLLRATEYDDLELIVADNESVERETLSYLDELRDDPRVRVTRVEGPFNFSRVNNHAAKIATGSILGFINNDVKVIHADWLQELVIQISQRNVGAVGAKLHYANDTIQHAGVILGLYGVAAHGHRHFPRDSIGYFGRPVLVQNISAVTAACMLVRRDVFDGVQGYNESSLAVGYNDVDLCLKIRKAGYDIVFTPFAELYHLESQSRGENLSPQQLERETRDRAYMLEHWGEVIQRDPFYNPNLTVDTEDFGLAFPPRVIKPWLSAGHEITSASTPVSNSSNQLMRSVGKGTAVTLGAQAGGPAGISADCHAQLMDLQQRFDAAFPVDAVILGDVARASSLIVVSLAPFTNVSALVDELADERIALGQLVVVDGTAEPVPGVTVRDHVARWRLRLPSTNVTIASYLRQEFRFADAVNHGLGAAQHPNLWILDLDCVPLNHGLEYLLKAFIIEGQRAIIVGETFASDGTLERAEIPRDAIDGATLDLLTTATEFTLRRSSPRGAAELSLLSPISECNSFWCGIFGGTRDALLNIQRADLFDKIFVTDAAIADVSLNLRAKGTKLVRSSGSACIRLRPQSISAVAPWEEVHDWRWLIEKRRPWAGIDVERIELVCPFYRGDLLLAIQVVGHAISLGMRVRLHTVMSLVPWVHDMSRDIDVESIPMPIAPAEECYAQVLAAYLHVSQRLDVSPRLARCHPSRSLSETGKNLLAYILEEIGLPPDSRLRNLQPPTNGEQQLVARQIMQPFGQDVVFLHPLGGWVLKSIPSYLLLELAGYVHDAGFKLVQIGGAADRQVDGCDGAILQNFLPSQWREIFALGRALIGVDSWTAHFATILDMPQVTLYGSTHPQHVNTKAWFLEKASPSLVLGPSVSCSPCNSFTCTRFVNRAYCTGYSIDGEALQAFLGSVRDPHWLTRNPGPQVIV